MNPWKGPHFSSVNTYEPPITTLSISASQQGFVIDNLVNSPFPLRLLKNIDIRFIDPNQITLVPLAESIRGTVKRLRFSAVSIHRKDDQRVPDFVSRLTNLETLIVDKIYVLRPGIGPTESLLCIPLVLRSTAAPIRKLCVELRIMIIDHLDSVDWSQIDHILTNQEPLRQLIEVNVTVISTSAIRGTIDTKTLKASVARRLPMTSQRGILRCGIGRS